MFNKTAMKSTQINPKSAQRNFIDKKSGKSASTQVSLAARLLHSPCSIGYAAIIYGEDCVRLRIIYVTVVM